MERTQHIHELIIEQVCYIYSIAYRMSCDHNYSEDITQDTVLTALEKQSSIREVSAIKSWLRRICINRILQDARRKKIINIEALEITHDVSDEKQFTPEEEIIIHESLKEIQSACFGYMATKLSVCQRAVFVLVEMFGVSIDEIAALLELSEGACKSHLHRARKNLASFFSQNCQHLNPDKECSCTCRSWKQLLSNREITKYELQKARIKPLYDTSGFLEKDNQNSLGKILYLFHRMPPVQPDALWYQYIIKKIAPLL